MKIFGLGATLTFFALLASSLFSGLRFFSSLYQNQSRKALRTVLEAVAESEAATQLKAFEAAL